MYKILVLLLFLIISGCTTNTIQPVPELPEEKLGYKPNPKLCLALSGGGLRSAVLSLGALQQLEESKLLNEVDIIASVSGGGWPIYGLLRHMENGISPLTLLNENGEYIKRFDQSDFISNSEIISNGLVQLTLGKLGDIFFRIIDPNRAVIFNNSLASAYGLEIQDKFYKKESFSAFKTIKLNQLSKYKDWNFPYPIFISSSLEGVAPPASNHEYNIDNLFELSPKWVGSPAHDYLQEFGKYLDLIQVVVASSGASDSPRTQNDLEISESGKGLELGDIKEFVKTPPHRIRKFLTLGGILKFGDKNLSLSDGRFIENTGVLPLIRRGCDEIIAIDARLDPYMFNVEFHLLKAIVRGLGGTMDIPDSLKSYSNCEKESLKLQAVKDGWEMSSHYYPVEVNLDKHRTKVHFLKLGLVEGESYADEVSSFIKENHSLKLKPEKIEFQCYKSHFKSKTIDVSLEEEPIGPTCGLGGVYDSFHTCSFPFSGTLITNYSPEESKAYRFLGKHLINVLLDNTSLSNGLNN